MASKSSNCRQYTDSVHIYVEADAQVPGDDRCRVKADPVFSCQTSAFEKPDEETETLLRERITAKLNDMNCDASRAVVNFTTVHMGARDIEYSGAKLSELGMASNCYKHGNDANDATHVIRAECTNQYDFVNDKGRRTRDTNKKFFSNLTVCDVSDKAMPQLMEDARKVAAFNANSNGYAVVKDTDLACVFSVLPFK